MRLVQVITDYIQRSILTTKGDLVVRGDAQPERLAAGALNTYLRGKGAGELPAYEAEPTKTAIRARLTGNQTIPTGVWTKLALATEDYDVKGEFDNVANYRFTATTAGKYLIILHGSLNDLADGTKIGVIIKKNGSYAGGFVGDIVGGVLVSGVNGVDILSLIVGDYIEGFISHEHGSDRIAVAQVYQNYMAIHQLS